MALGLAAWAKRQCLNVFKDIRACGTDDEGPAGRPATRHDQFVIWSSLFEQRWSISGGAEDHALAYLRELKLAPDHYELPMHYGIRGQWQQRLVDQGQRLMIYVPCGEAWYPYFMRRRAERPRNVIFLATNVH